MLQALRQDLHYALRRLARNPGFAALVVPILALPFRNPDQLLQFRAGDEPGRIARLPNLEGRQET